MAFKMNLMEKLFSNFSTNSEKQYNKQSERENKEEMLSAVPEEDAIIINDGYFNLSGYGTGFGSNDGINDELTEEQSISTYRELARRPEIDQAIQEIVNDAVVTDYIKNPVSLSFVDDKCFGENTKKVIVEEFNTILRLLNFKETAPEKFRQWYIDGKCYYHAVLDSQKANAGIISIRQIDPRKIKKVIEYENITKKGVTHKRVKEEYYKYSNYIDTKSTFGWENQTRKEVVKIHPDTIAYSNSGIFKEKRSGEVYSISYLEKALKTANQLKLLEDSLVIYRLARAPERRVFNVDVGSLPKIKAEQYMHSLMNKYRNKMVYNSNTGSVADQRNLVSMLEDFWLPKREGRGTDISTLPGGQGLGQIEDVDYFRKKLYNSLNIPSTRYNTEALYSIGRSGELTREEIKFSKFVEMLRCKFSKFLLKLLEIQLIQKNVLSLEEFRKNENNISFVWNVDMHWREIADNEILNNRLASLQAIEPFIDVYFTKEWVLKNVLRFTEEEIEHALKMKRKDKNNTEE